MHSEQNKTDSDVFDFMSVKEEEFEESVNYIAPDVATDPGCPNRAEKSLPRNLELRPSKSNNVSYYICHYLSYLILSADLLKKEGKKQHQDYGYLYTVLRCPTLLLN